MAMATQCCWCGRVRVLVFSLANLARSDLCAPPPPPTTTTHHPTTPPRFANNTFVAGEPHIRFYAGAPLVSTNSGHRYGGLQGVRVLLGTGVLRGGRPGPCPVPARAPCSDGAIVRVAHASAFTRPCPNVHSPLHHHLHASRHAGTLCVFDFKPRSFDAGQYAVLCHFAEILVREMEVSLVRPRRLFGFACACCRSRGSLGGGARGVRAQVSTAPPAPTPCFTAQAVSWQQEQLRRAEDKRSHLLRAMDCFHGGLWINRMYVDSLLC